MQQKITRNVQFSTEVIKIAKDKNKSYLGAMVVTAPAAVAQSLSNFPKGWADEKVRQSVFNMKGGKGLGPHPSLVKGLPKDILKDVSARPIFRGLGRAGGNLGAALITTPAFLGGIKKLRDAKTSDQKLKGTAQVVGAGALYGAIKGSLEQSIATKSIDPKYLLSKTGPIRGVGKSRGIVSALQAGLTAKSIAGSMRREKKGDKSLLNRFIAPAAAGGIYGAMKGVSDPLITYGKKSLKSPRLILGHAGGRMASGIIGAVALNEIARALIGGKEKKAFDLHGVQPLEANERVQHVLNTTPARKKLVMQHTPTNHYRETTIWANLAPANSVIGAYKNMSKADPERNPSRRAVYYALHDNLKRRGEDVPTPPMRYKVNGLVESPNVVDMSMLLAAAAAPGLIFAGTQRATAASAEDKLLSEALDSIRISQGIERINSGSSHPGFWDTNSPYAAEYPVHETHTTPLGTETRIRAQRFIDLPHDTHPAILAHELGHATGGPLRGLLRSKAAKLLHGAGSAGAILLPLAALGIGIDKSFTTVEELEKRKEFVSTVGKASALLMAPVLAEEALASMKGIGYMTAANWKPLVPAAGLQKSLALAVRKSGPLLKGFSTYAAPLAIPFLAAALLKGKGPKEFTKRSFVEDTSIVINPVKSFANEVSEMHIERSYELEAKLKKETRLASGTIPIVT